MTAMMTSGTENLLVGAPDAEAGTEATTARDPHRPHGAVAWAARAVWVFAVTTAQVCLLGRDAIL